MRTILVLLLAAVALAQVPPSSYRVENIPTPREIAPEVSALTFGADGRLYACFRRGYIYALDLKSSRWSRFAEGLQTPMGILAGKPGEFFVVHLPELTRIADTDGDGVADLYETVSDAWGMSGNYHEFVYGPERDKAGNFYVAMGLASHGAEPRPPVRGNIKQTGRRARNPQPGAVNQVQHYSPVPYRGCALRISPDGQATPISCGFRQPNGLILDEDGNLFATDNQGDWVGTSPLHHVEPGDFHGHPASLNWDPRFKDRDPVTVPVEELDKLRKKPAILFPQNDMAGSVAGMAWDRSEGAFGPYTGQLFVAEWTYPRILRVDLEKVQGVFQGAAFIFAEGNGLRMANNRIAFSPDGRSLYTAQTSRIWGATEGLQRIVFTGSVPFDILRMRLTEKGFTLQLTEPVDPLSAQRPEAWSMVRYSYRYHSAYGSPKTEVAPVKISRVSVSPDSLTVELELENLESGRVYELRPGGIRSVSGEALTTRLAAYTINALR